MTTPGVGPVVALTYRATVDVPARFHKSKAIGAVFGLTCSKSQSGEIDRSGRITGCSARGLSAVGEGAAFTDIAFEPVSSNRSLRCGETEFSGQRQRGRNGLGDSRTPVQRQNLARRLRQFGANRRVPGNLR
jgi:transposase